MARYTGADCKLCRREKMKLYLKGAKCDSPKCPIEIRPYPPGEHGRNRPKESEYLLQIREKQKARRVYGILERQFHNYYEEATRKRGKTGENLLQILESRLDNVVYRAGFAKSRDMARQLVSHGHFLVNGKKVDIPSYRVSTRRHRRGAAGVAGDDPVRDRQGRGGRADGPRVARGHPGQDAGPRPRPAGPDPDRHPGARAAHRGAVLEVKSFPAPPPGAAGWGRDGRWPSGQIAASNSGRRGKG